MKLLFILIVLLLSRKPDPLTELAPSDSSRAVNVMPKVYPQESKRDYKRFMKIYNDPLLFEKLVKGKDSSQVQRLLGRGETITAELFDLTFAFSDSAFNYALLYKNHFADFKVKADEWYLQQFVILFDGEGKAYKIFDHQTRGSNLFDKRKKKSV
jgi:hypothetical protein